jgi:hypothetical protein
MTTSNSLPQYKLGVFLPSVADLRDLLNLLGSSLNAIEVLDLEPPLHKVFLSQLVLERIDEHSRKEWEVRSSSQQFTRLAELWEFLENRCKALELIKSTQSSKGISSVKEHLDNSKQATHAKQAYVTTNSQCMFYNQMYPLQMSRISKG